MDLDCQCSNKSHSDKPSCDGSAQRTTRRTTLRELMQLPADCESPPRNSSESQTKTSEHLDCHEQDNLEQLEAVPKQQKRWRNWKCVKGLSWSSFFKPRDTENNRPQRNKSGGASAKGTKLWENNQIPQSEIKIERSPGTEPSCCNEERQGNFEGTRDLQPHRASTCESSEVVCSPCGESAGLLPGCDNVVVDRKASPEVKHDEEHSCPNSADQHERYSTEQNELVEDGVKEGCKTSSFDTHEAEQDVNEETVRNLQQNDSTDLDVEDGKIEMCLEYNHMPAQSSEGGSEENNTSWNASALLSADFGSPYRNVSESKTWEIFELFDVWNEEAEKMKKLCNQEEERLKKQEAVPKVKKWWGIITGNKLRSWSSLLKPRDGEKKQHQRKNKQKLARPKDEENKKPRRKNKMGDLPRDMENKKPERMNKHQVTSNMERQLKVIK